MTESESTRWGPTAQRLSYRWYDVEHGSIAPAIDVRVLFDPEVDHPERLLMQLRAGLNDIRRQITRLTLDR